MNLFANETLGKPPKDIHFQIMQESYRLEDRLLKYLFKDYNPYVIPRDYRNYSLKLYVGLAMIQLINMVMYNF